MAGREIEVAKQKDAGGLPLEGLVGRTPSLKKVAPLVHPWFVPYHAGFWRLTQDREIPQNELGPQLVRPSGCRRKWWLPITRNTSNPTLRSAAIRALPVTVECFDMPRL